MAYIGVLGTVLFSFVAVALGVWAGIQRRQLRSVSAENENLVAQNANLWDANQEAEARYHEDQAQLSGQDNTISVLDTQLKGYQRKALVIVRHTVFLDGTIGGGKTTLIERIVNPMAGDSDGPPATTKEAARMPPMPVCFQEVRETDGFGNTVIKVRLHVIEFVDIPGEKPEAVTDMFDDYVHAWSDLNQTSSATEVKGSAVALWVWDVAQAPEANAKHMNEARVQSVYQPKKARNVINGRIIVFLNKCDDIRRSVGSDALKVRLGAHRDFVQSNVFVKLGLGGDSLEFVSGAAITGEGVPSCLGAIYKKLEIDKAFPSARG